MNNRVYHIAWLTILFFCFKHSALGQTSTAKENTNSFKYFESRVNTLYNELIFNDAYINFSKVELGKCQAGIAFAYYDRAKNRRYILLNYLKLYNEIWLKDSIEVPVLTKSFESLRNSINNYANPTKSNVNVNINVNIKDKSKTLFKRYGPSPHFDRQTRSNNHPASVIKTLNDFNQKIQAIKQKQKIIFIDNINEIINQVTVKQAKQIIISEFTKIEKVNNIAYKENILKAVIAHEWAHHYLGHIFFRGNYFNERNADILTGRILSQNNVSIEISSHLSTLFTQEGDSQHLASTNRVFLISKGFLTEQVVKLQECNDATFKELVSDVEPILTNLGMTGFNAKHTQDYKVEKNAQIEVFINKIKHDSNNCDKDLLSFIYLKDIMQKKDSLSVADMPSIWEETKKRVVNRQSKYFNYLDSTFNKVSASFKSKEDLSVTEFKNTFIKKFKAIVTTNSLTAIDTASFQNIISLKDKQSLLDITGLWKTIEHLNIIQQKDSSYLSNAYKETLAQKPLSATNELLADFKKELLRVFQNTPDTIKVDVWLIEQIQKTIDEKDSTLITNNNTILQEIKANALKEYTKFFSQLEPYYQRTNGYILTINQVLDEKETNIKEHKKQQISNNIGQLPLNDFLREVNSTKFRLNTDSSITELIDYFQEMLYNKYYFNKEAKKDSLSCYTKLESSGFIIKPKNINLFKFKLKAINTDLEFDKTKKTLKILEQVHNVCPTQNRPKNCPPEDPIFTSIFATKEGNFFIDKNYFLWTETVGAASLKDKIFLQRFTP